MYDIWSESCSILEQQISRLLFSYEESPQAKQMALPVPSSAFLGEPRFSRFLLLLVFSYSISFPSLNTSNGEKGFQKEAKGEVNCGI